MTTTATDTYERDREMIAILTEDAFELARATKRVAAQVTNLAARKELLAQFDSAFRAVRLGVALKDMLKRSQARMAREADGAKPEPSVRERPAVAAPSQPRDRDPREADHDPALTLMRGLLAPERVQAHIDELRAAARPEGLPDAEPPSAPPPPRTQAEIATAALAAKRRAGPAPPFRRTG